MGRKIGILTFHASDNFGSVLQAYALSKCLLENGADCEIIDYRKEAVQQLYRIIQPFDNRHHIVSNIYSVLHYKALSKRKALFEDFRNKYLPLSEQRFDKKEDLELCVYDRYVTGSDQVWNYDIIDFDLSYMFDFAKGDKVSYAASFGPREKHDEVLKYKSYLETFSNISVRECAALDLCVDKLDVSAKLVCDPVFLLSREDWKAVAKPYKKRPQRYVLCYFPGGVPNNVESFTQKVADQLGCKRVLIMPEWRNIIRPGQKAYDCGPREFLDLIINAECVCTTSFHGTALSILFGKSFYAAQNNGDERLKILMGFLPRQAIIHCVDDLIYASSYEVLPELSDFIAESKEYIVSAILK